MTRYSRSSVRVDDPYCFLAINIFDEIFRTIECYFYQTGTEEEITEGKRSIRWIKRMEGNFKQLALASGLPLDKFHQLCIWKINKIKQAAYEKYTMDKELGEGTQGGEGNIEMGSSGCREESTNN